MTLRPGRVMAFLTLGILSVATTASAGSVHVGHPRVKAPKWGSRESHVRFYQKYMAKYNRNPKAFAQRHRLMNRAILNPAFKQAMIRRLLSHPKRFYLNHPCFAKFLDGELHAMQSPSNPPNPAISRPGPSSYGPEGQGLDGGTGGSPSNPPAPIPSNPVVPEPSSILLVGTALIAGGLALASKERHRRKLFPASTP